MCVCVLCGDRRDGCCPAAALNTPLSVKKRPAVREENVRKRGKSEGEKGGDGWRAT